ncbi:response regulator [Sphingomonas sp. PB4P5]|uniref:response regulator n=1 Tax=Parasphingomonas puruogangriensis TaxID=3096155 RepID=UPI002FCBA7FE
MARIIYVEDDELAGDLVREVLTEAGHLVGVIGHGTLAFDTIAFKKPELVILDRSVPGMQGLEILKRLRQMPSMYLTPILMLTGDRNPKRANEAMLAGADDYLVKPFQPEDLVQRVAAAIAAKSFAANRRIR